MRMEHDFDFIVRNLKREPEKYREFMSQYEKINTDLKNIEKFRGTQSEITRRQSQLEFDMDRLLEEYDKIAGTIHFKLRISMSDSLMSEGYEITIVEGKEIIMRSDGLHRWAVGYLVRNHNVFDSDIDVVWLNADDAKRHKPNSWEVETE